MPRPSKPLILLAAVLLFILFGAIDLALFLEFLRPPNLGALEHRVFPILIVAFVFGAPFLTTFLAIAWRAHHLKPPYACPTCGYDLRIHLANRLPRCPECGAPIHYSGPTRDDY